MQYFGKLGPMSGKVAIQVKLPALNDSRIRAKLLLPDGNVFQNKVFGLLVTKSNFINTLNDRKTLLDWAHEWDREQTELKGSKNDRNSVNYELDDDNNYVLTFTSKSSHVSSEATTSRTTVQPTDRLERAKAVPSNHATSAQLNTTVARDFLYQQLGRLEVKSSTRLPDSPGLYAVFEPGQAIGSEIPGLPKTTLRCVKFGMTKGQTILKRINGQYCGKSHRASISRMLVGDALVGRALQQSHDLAGIPFETLSDFRRLWNVGSSEGNVLKKCPIIAEKLKLINPVDVRKLEASLETRVTEILQTWRFVAIPAGEADIDLIENSANSLLSDMSYADPATSDWLGQFSSRETVQKQGIWASVGVEGGRAYNPYVSHASIQGRNETGGEPIADWLGRLQDLIDIEVRR